MRSTPTPHLAGGLLALVMLVTACSPSALAFTIGECINLPDGDQITDYESVECSEAHDAEVYALPQHPDGEDAPFPGQAALNDLAAERCLGEFEDYVGTAYEQSLIFFSPLIPSEDSWNDANDREIVCLLRGENIDGGFEQLTGSKRDSGE